jgi:hypothetical protein
MLAGHITQMMLWAAAYLALDAIEGFEQVLFFSMVTFTTLGYGDFVLEQGWLLLGSFEAAVGIIMFGWTSAIVGAVVHRIYQSGKATGDGDAETAE